MSPELRQMIEDGTLLTLLRRCEYRVTNIGNAHCPDCGESKGHLHNCDMRKAIKLLDAEGSATKNHTNKDVTNGGGEATVSETDI